ncbi:MAG TPA: indolepyruvate oxidoreductase subunit beta [Smithella sp.]|nr:indolepyruvate oxidoreductase subunit beta [Smithella sp.]HRS96617.1 indolepyruvate oxidoreductase subunit beta [Smithella sp.]
MIYNEVKNILFAGVGGQGILRASDIVCEVVMNAGWDVKKSEVHGMAQRGGCVTSHVRFGKKVYSPLAEPGSVDILVSFEKMESLRYISFLKKETAIIVNNDKILPPEVNLGETAYPLNIIEYLEKNYKKVVSVNATSLAKKAGNVKAANVVLLGALSNLLNVEKSLWGKVISGAFPEKLKNLNLEAFQSGINA